MEKLQRKKQGSKSYYRCKEEIREYINLSVKEIPWDSLKLIVVEQLKNIKYKMKVKRRLTKSIRRFISNWTYRYILSSIESMAEENGVSFRSVSAWNTSIACPVCGHMDKKNRRTQEHFLCLNCGHSDNADYNASKNVLLRFLTGPYGARYKPKDIDLLEYLSIA